MEKNLEEKLFIPSPVLTLEESSQRNPLFQKTLNQIKSPRERAAFLGMFRNYLLSAYENNPQMNRLMKTHDLAEKVEGAPEIDNYDAKSIVDAQLYSEPGRAYQYTNNISGYERKKKGLLKRLYHTTKDFTFETLPGIIGLGGWYGAKRWHSREVAKGLSKRALESFEKPWYKYLNPFNIAKDSVELAAGEKILGMVGSALNPAKYLLGGYFLYKTIRYFMKKYKEKKELKEMNRQVWMQNHMLAQRV
jgi:hypothetical protein